MKFGCSIVIGDLQIGRRFRFCFWPLILAFFTMAVPAQAKSVPDSEPLAIRFEKVAEEARLALVDGAAGYSYERLKKLEDLRARLAHDRDIFGKISQSGTLETRILESQIKDLGAPPGEGEAEPSAITKQREKLDEELASLMEPILRMRQMRVRAATLVTEIDERIASIKHRHLMRRGYSALDPRVWVDATAGLGEMVSNGAATMGQTVKAHGIFTMLILIASAIVLAVLAPALLSRVWSNVRLRIERAIAQSNSLARNLGLISLENFGSAVVFAVLLILVTAVLIFLLTPFVEKRELTQLGTAFVFAALFPAIAQWLGRSVILSPYKELRLIQLPNDRAQKALLTVRNAGIILALEFMLAVLEETAIVSLPLASLLSAAFVILGSALLWRLANLIISSRKVGPAPIEVSQDGPSEGEEFDFATPLGRFLKLFAIASFLTALAGYVMLAREIFSSVLITLAAIAIAIYLNRTVKLVSSTVAAGALQSYRKFLQLLPLLTGLALFVGTLLIIALIWGYRPQEIGDALIALRDGIDFGDVRISAGDVVTFALVFVAGYAATRFVQRFLRLSILPQFDLELGGKAAIVTGVGYLGVLLAAVVAIGSTGLDLSSLAFVAGALSVGLGFGLQSVVENFTSGILLLVERPIKEGDWIEVGEYSGIVRKISVRSTQIETFDRHHIIIPNSQLITGSVKNLSFSGGPARITVFIGVAYGSDLDKVRSLLIEVAKKVPNVLPDPEPFTVFAGFGDNSIDLKLFCFVADVTTGAGTQSELYLGIARRFEKEGVEIPFPQRDLHIRSGPESLFGAANGLPSQG